MKCFSSPLFVVRVSVGTPSTRVALDPHAPRGAAVSTATNTAARDHAACAGLVPLPDLIGRRAGGGDGGCAFIILSTHESGLRLTSADG